MKITRSALKNLIKEEMNRINEDPDSDRNPLDLDPSSFDKLDRKSKWAPVTASGTGTENVGDALIGMSESDKGFQPMLQGFVDGGQVEGLEELRDVGIVTRPEYQRLEAERIRSVDYRLHLQWPKTGWQGEGGVFYVKVDRQAGEIRRPSSMHRQSLRGGSGMPGDVPHKEWDKAQAEVKTAMETFNSQNEGKGAQIMIGGAPVAASAGYYYEGSVHTRSTWGTEIEFPISSEA